MYSRVVETDTEVVVKHYRVLGAAVAILFNWFFVYETFSTESGGLMTLLLATLSLLIAAGLAEIRTSRFDREAQLLEVTTLGTLGPNVVRIPFAEVLGMSLERKGNDTAAVESLTVHTRDNGSIEIAGYVVLKGSGGGLDQYLQDWLAQAGWAPRQG